VKKLAKTKGVFLERINRFSVKVKVYGKEHLAYLPNPGRLWELLIKGREVILSRNKSGKFPYTILGCIKDGYPVLLHTGLTNKIVKKLIEEGKIPFLRGHRIVKEEVRFNRSRIDFLLEEKRTGEKLFLEIKTCSLFGKDVAMFPDAVSERGRRHLEELSGLTKYGYKAGCLFVVMKPDVKYFLPAYHFDFEFARTFLNLRRTINLWAISLKFKGYLEEPDEVKILNIPYDIIEKEAQNRGAYFLILETPSRKIKIGSLGEICFKNGFYIYVGSARLNLFQRIKRHLRKRKKFRWHIDYLTQVAKRIRAIPVMTSKNLECEMAEKLSFIAEETISGFGAGDCSCKTHLFYFSADPIKNEKFIEVLNFFMLDYVLNSP